MGCTGCSNKAEKWSVLIKPTHSCNFNCKYCYDEPHRRKFGSTVMTMETLNDVISKIAKHTNRLELIWHGGEPLMVGKQWYIDAQKILGLYPELEINQSLQTNGSLLDAEWAELSLKYNIEMGISFDGPYQGIRNSQNDAVEASIKEYRNAGGKSGFICVINKANYNNIIDIYEYFKTQMQSGVSFNRVFDTLQTSENELGIDVDDYRKRFVEYYNYWLRDTTCINERTVREYTNHVLGLGGSICIYGDCRNKWLGINPVGDIYPCDRYVPDRYSPGNIKDYDSIEDVFNSEQYKLYYDENTERLKECRECDYGIYCSGGCIANHITVMGDATKNSINECNTYMQSFRDVYDSLRKVDIYTERLNDFMVEDIVTNHIFTVKEITDALAEIDSSIKLKYDGDTDKLIHCSEFKVFRLINPVMKAAFSTHIDYMAKDVKISVNLEDPNVFNIIRAARTNALTALLLQNIEYIRKITA